MRYEVTGRSEKAADAMWKLLSDVEGWPRLIDTYESVRLLQPGPLAVGSTAHVVQRGLRPGDYRVTALDDARSFTWESRQPGVRLVGAHRVDPAGDGCRLTLAFEVSGAMAWLVSALMGARIRRYVDIELQAFLAAG
jgi:hypothetical protein